MTPPLDDRAPVLVGVGTASADAEATDLMARALVAAAEDAGSTGLLGEVDRIAVPQGSWAYPDPGRLVAGAVGAGRARTHLVELGIPQQHLVNQALAAIAAGESDVAVVVGGEAKRWARGTGPDGRPVAETMQEDATPDVLHRRAGDILEPVEVATGLWEPVQQYAMIDNALRHAEGQTLTQHRADIADLWARCNAVAGHNPKAAFPAPMTAADIDTPSPANRPLAFPYNKWHATQWTVDQAAALVLCSVSAARRLGLATDRWLFPLVGLESSQAVSLLRRARPWAWPAMGVLGRAAARHLGRPVATAEVVETYSCFPAAVRVQQRELDLDTAGTPTITGGMAFAGGPYNNFVYQATAAVAPRLRERPGALGLVTTVSGLLTKPGLAVWCSEPGEGPPLVADLADEAAAATGVVDMFEDLGAYGGPATVATYTVTYDGADPVRTVALCDTASGPRCIAFSDDPAVAAFAVDHELCGTSVAVTGGAFTPA